LLSTTGALALPELFHRAWQRAPKGLDIDGAVSVYYQAGVGTGNAARLRGMVIDIPEGAGQGGYAKAKAEVTQPLDGGPRVSHEESLIARTDSTRLQEPLRSKARKKSKLKTACEEHWVFMASAVQRGHLLLIVMIIIILLFLIFL
jgi:hypothetical protein